MPMRYPSADPRETAAKADVSPESSSTRETDAAAVREQTQRILSEPIFRNSKRYTDLLRFIVERTLEGQVDDLHERTIGIEVFGRAPDYDTAVDPTVRVAATEVRKRLALYYTGPGREQEVRIEVPVRSYVAEFRFAKLAPNEPQSVTEEKSRATAVPTFRSPKLLSQRRRQWLILTPIVLTLLVLFVWGVHRQLAPVSQLDTFWAPMTDDSNQAGVLICIGISGRTRPNASSTSPLSNSVVPDAREDELPPQRGIVPMMDVSAASTIGSFLHRKGRESQVVPANGTTLSDLRNGPAILLGSFDNEWTVRLGAGLHYRFQKKSDLGSRWIEDAANPSTRNWAVDLSTPQSELGDNFALISRIRDPTTGQWWVGIGGLTGLGTLAAEQTLTDQISFASIAAHLPKDWSTKNTQIVLEVKVVHGSPGVPQVVAVQSW